MIRKVIILGGHIQALGLARQAHSCSCKVILCISDRNSVAAFSNCVDKVIIYSTIQDLLASILTYKSDVIDCLLFPTNDEMVLFLKDNLDCLNSYFLLGIPSSDVVDLFNNKRNSYRFCERNSIPCPKSFYPITQDDVSNIADTVLYPVVIKPAIMYSFHSLFGKKAFRCDDKNSLLSKIGEIAPKFPISNLVIQEFIPGGPKNLYSYGTFAYKGKPQSAVIANRIRQNPMDFGNSTTFAITCYVKEIQETAELILSNTGYTGLAEIEFMYDERTNQYKFLEVNTRAWKWHTISLGLGFGFFSDMINFYNGVEPDPSHRDFSVKVGWEERLTDYVVSFKEITKGRLSIENFNKTRLVKKTYAVWNRRDVIPFFAYLLLSPILYYKRY